MLIDAQLVEIERFLLISSEVYYFFNSRTLF